MKDLIQAQYEELPYPPRDPARELDGLIEPSLDSPIALKQICGVACIDRALVAGCGTGDAVVYLAVKLPNTTIIGFDFSQAALDITQARLDKRKIGKNVELIQGDLSAMPDFKPFDYINSSGVLHHMPDPVEALKGLAAVATPGAIISIMIYGKYGRTGIEQMQTLLRLMITDGDSRTDKINFANRVLASLPPSNWYERGKKQFPCSLGEEMYDRFFNAREVSYDVSGVYKLVRDAELEFVDWALPNNKIRLKPERHIVNWEILDRVKKLPRETQESIVELFVGNINKHCFYVRKPK